MKENGMSLTYSTHGRDEESQELLVGKLRERDRCGDFGEDRRMILEWILKE